MDSLNAHLQTMSGTPSNPLCPPLIFTAGLPALSSLWLTLSDTGGADVVMASTAYGGSSELTDIYEGRGGVRKHKFDITGSNPVIPGIKTVLDTLERDPEETEETSEMKRMKRTVVFVEVPSNPDMKVVDLGELREVLEEYGERVGKEVSVC